MHAIPLAPACFQLEKLWANKVLETSSRQQRLRLGLILSPAAAAAPFHAVTFLTSVWLILTAVFIHIPSPNESKKQPGSHHQCEEIYIYVCIMAPFQMPPLRHLSKRLCWICYFPTWDCQLVLTCCNKLVTVALGFREEAEKEITRTIGWDSRVSTGKHSEI